MDNVIHYKRRSDQPGPFWCWQPSSQFDNAIEVGAFSHAPYEFGTAGFAGDYMYMYSDGGFDFFKHKETREYIKVRSTL